MFLSLYRADIALLVLFLLTLWSASSVARGDVPPNPQWMTTGCSSPFELCANVTTMETWSSGSNKVYFFLEARADASNFDASNVTVWYVGENYDPSWAAEMRKLNVNVVRFHPRGGDLSYPKISCSPDNFNNKNYCWPNPACAEEIKKSGLALQHFSVEETASDLAWVLRKMGSHQAQNIVVAEGLGTFVVERMLQTQGGMDNVSVIMAGFSQPKYFDTFETINGYDAAMQQVLSFCQHDTTMQCVGRTGALEGMWDRLINVLTAAEQNTLKCNSHLKWGVSADLMHQEYRSILAVMLKNPQQFVMQPDTSMMLLIPSFIYRLQRCLDSDVAALTKLRDYVKSEPSQVCPSFTPQRYNWLVNDLTQKPPLSPEELLRVTAVQRVVLPNISIMKTLYNVYEAYPKYNVTNRDIVQTQVPLLLLVSDVDPIFPLGFAAQTSSVYNRAIRVFIPFQTGFPVATTAKDCISKNVENMYKQKGWLSPSKCITGELTPPDFLGVNAYKYYGVTDAWEFTTPNAPEVISGAVTTTTTPAPTPSPNPSGDCSHKGTAVLGVFFAMSIVALGALSFLLWKKTREAKFSDDFYSNLNR